MDKSKLQALAEIILPPGSTSTDLQDAVDLAASGDTITISGDMPFTNTVIIPAGKEIIIQSDTGNNWTLSQTFSGARHFNIKGGLILQDVTLDGGNTGGGVKVEQGSITINSGAVIENCYADDGGGVYLDGDFIMNGGSIRNNKVDRFGGGLYIQGGTGVLSGGNISNNAATMGGGVYGGSFTLSGGEISGNNASEVAGGILPSASLEITGGKISNNTAGYYAGGVYGGTNINMTGGEISGNRTASVFYNGFGGGGIFCGGTLTLSGGTISGNTAINGNGGGVYAFTGAVLHLSDMAITGNESVHGNGGGVYLKESASVNVSSSGFTNNRALNGDGGGIYTEDTTYANITTGNDTVFSSNRASAAYNPPDNAAILYPGIQFQSTTITVHPLNNFDVNYTEGEPITETYHVSYHANGGTGSHRGPDIIPGGTDTVLSPDETGISRPGFTFIGWNTSPDGSGTPHAPGDVITVTDGITLYAQWKRNPAPKKLCRAPVTNCRISIEGQKIWEDDDNAGGKRPEQVEILLLRDGEVYQRTLVNEDNDWFFGFCCLPKWKNFGEKYNYEVDEVTPEGYTKMIEGYDIINTLIP